jgi:SNW domain-containing protein 1
MPQDPLEQTKFKHKRIPAAANEEPVPIIHSLSKKLTREDQMAWNIPPSVSNWKNAKGFTIPLEMRLSADGRNLKNVKNIFKKKIF